MPESRRNMSTSDKDLKRLLENLDNHEGRLRRLETQEIGVASGGGLPLIEEQTPSGVSSTTFSAIPGTYRHLMLAWIAQSDAATIETGLQMEFNGDTTATNYHWSRHDYLDALGGGADRHEIFGANALMVFGLIPSEAAADVDPNEFGVGWADLNYYSGDKWKNILSISASFTGGLLDNEGERAFSGRWKNTAAISSLLIRTSDASNFEAGTTFALYGVN